MALVQSLVWELRSSNPTQHSQEIIFFFFNFKKREGKEGRKRGQKEGTKKGGKEGRKERRFLRDSGRKWFRGNFESIYPPTLPVLLEKTLLPGSQSLSESSE